MKKYNAKGWQQEIWDYLVHVLMTSVAEPSEQLPDPPRVGVGVP